MQGVLAILIINVSLLTCQVDPLKEHLLVTFQHLKFGSKSKKHQDPVMYGFSKAEATKPFGQEKKLVDDYFKTDSLEACLLDLSKL